MSKKILIPVLDGNIDHYLAAVERQGAEPVVVHDCGGFDEKRHSTGTAEAASAADAILLPGGADLDPKRYGENPDGVGAVNDDLDSLQLFWLDVFVKAGKPAFGICRGHQVINVYFGGTLIQNLPDRETHAKKSLAEPDKYHDAKAVGRDSWIYEVYHETEFHINSSHHEAVDRLGEGLVPDLWSTAPADTRPVLEAMHSVTHPVWSVQFHPERCNAEFPEPGLIDGDRIFRYWIGRI